MDASPHMLKVHGDLTRIVQKRNKRNENINETKHTFCTHKVVLTVASSVIPFLINIVDCTSGIIIGLLFFPVLVNHWRTISPAPLTAACVTQLTITLCVYPQVTQSA